MYTVNQKAAFCTKSWYKWVQDNAVGRSYISVVMCSVASGFTFMPAFKGAATETAHAMCNLTVCFLQVGVCACLVNNTERLHEESTTLERKDKDSIYILQPSPNGCDVAVGAKSAVVLQPPPMVVLRFHEPYLFNWLYSSIHFTPMANTTSTCSLFSSPEFTPPVY